MEAHYEVSITTARPDIAVDAAFDLVQRAVRTVLQQEGVPPCEVSVYMTDDQEIQSLNAEYRDKDAPTDVLSFALMEDAAGLLGWTADRSEDDMPTQEAPVPLLLGDIVISVERAAAQAEEYGHEFDRELAFLAVHGTLHLLGYDHLTDKERQLMREREEAALEELGLPR